MILRKFTKDDFYILEKWVTSADLLFQFAGATWQFPLTIGQIEQYQKNFPLRQFYTGCTDGGHPVAFGEIIRGDVNSPRLGRLLVGNSTERGQGLGLQFVNLLTEECKKSSHDSTVYLYVFENNLSAIRCYRKAGFTNDSAGSITFMKGDLPYTATIMSKSLIENKI